MFVSDINGQLYVSYIKQCVHFSGFILLVLNQWFVAVTFVIVLFICGYHINVFKGNQIIGFF